MRVLLVDDELPARQRLKTLLLGLGSIEIVGEAENGRDAFEAAANLHPDLVLLDIRMPGMDGLETARHLARLEPAPAVIFCTAYEEHALEAFEANALDYVLKPVRSERLKIAIDRARKLSGEELKALEKNKDAARRRSHICARVRGNLVLVPLLEVDYFLSEDKYVMVHYRKGAVLIEESLKTLEDEFSENFVRIHRNCLVARAKLAGLMRGADGRIFARLTTSTTLLEVSRRNLPSLRRLARSM